MSTFIAARSRPALILVLVVALAVGACGGSPSSGRTVHVLGPWIGPEEQAFKKVLSPFEHDHRMIHVEYEGTRDLSAVLASRVENGDPPDVAVLPSPGQLQNYAPHMVALGTVVDERGMAKDYGESWRRLGLVDNQRYAIVVKAAVKNLVWYVPTRGYLPPPTWNKMLQVSRNILQTGRTPWCVGLRDSSVSGWPGTDWIEAIVLRQSGQDTYNRWARGQLSWTSPQIRQAFTAWQKIVGDPRMVHGGARAMLLTSFTAAGRPLFSNPPGCVFDQEASFIASSYEDYKIKTHHLAAGTDFSFRPFPQIDPAISDVQEIGADLLGMFHDTPAGRQLVRYLTTEQAQRVGVEHSDWISPNRKVPLSSYPDTSSRQLSQLLTRAATVCFDASDLMPDALRTAFYQAVLTFVTEPRRLTEILATLDHVQATAATDPQLAPSACA